MSMSSAKADAELVRLRKEDGNSLDAMLDGPGRNGFSPRLSRVLAVLDEVEASTDVVVAILAGLPEIFSSGATREVLEAIREGQLLPTELVLGRRLMGLRVPVIAARPRHERKLRSSSPAT